MARFFIDRPVFARVVSILIMGIGILAIRTLPIAQYPQIAPPTVSVNATYPGASAETVANFSSTSSSAGSTSITLTFETGTDPTSRRSRSRTRSARRPRFCPSPCSARA